MCVCTCLISDSFVLLYGIFRAVQGQVDDQDVYCRFGLKLCGNGDELIVDPDGCQAIVKYGKLTKNFFVLIGKQCC